MQIYLFSYTCFLFFSLPILSPYEKPSGKHLGCGGILSYETLTFVQILPLPTVRALCRATRRCVDTMARNYTYFGLWKPHLRSNKLSQWERRAPRFEGYVASLSLGSDNR